METKIKWNNEINSKRKSKDVIVNPAEWPLTLRCSKFKLVLAFIANFLIVVDVSASF